MHIVRLLILILSTFFIGCLPYRHFNCSDCSDQKSIHESTNQQLRKDGKNIDDYFIRIFETPDTYEVSITEKKLLTDSINGGGVILEIRKTDCKVISYMRTK